MEFDKIYYDPLEILMFTTKHFIALAEFIGKHNGNATAADWCAFFSTHNSKFDAPKFIKAILNASADADHRREAEIRGEIVHS